MDIIYNNGEEEGYKAPKKVVKTSESTLANWMFNKGLVKTPKGGEMVLVFVIFIIFVIAAITFSYGIGVNKLKDVEDNGGSEFLEKK